MDPLQNKGANGHSDHHNGEQAKHALDTLELVQQKHYLSAMVLFCGLGLHSTLVGLSHKYLAAIAIGCSMHKSVMSLRHAGCAALAFAVLTPFGIRLQAHRGAARHRGEAQGAASQSPGLRDDELLLLCRAAAEQAEPTQPARHNNSGKEMGSSFPNGVIPYISALILPISWDETRTPDTRLQKRVWLQSIHGA